MPRATLVVGLMLLACTASPAQRPDAGRSLRVAVDNDLIALRGAGAPPDYDYTHGTRITAAWADAPGWARRFAGRKPPCGSASARRRGCIATALEVAQEIYTPRRDAADPVPGERPYAGWLYASATAHVVSAGRTRSAHVTVGVTGPPSLAAETQRFLHRVLRNEAQLGWAHQVAFEPGVAIGYDERLHRERPLGGTSAGRVGVSWGAIVGNVRTVLHAGTDVRVGLRARSPWVPLEPDWDQPMSFYLIAGYRQDLVLRDRLIEGSTRRGSAGARLRTAVRQYEFGFGVRRRAYTVAYRHVSRGKEYLAQPGPHAYGSVAFALHRY